MATNVVQYRKGEEFANELNVYVLPIPMKQYGEIFVCVLNKLTEMIDGPTSF